MVVQDGSCSFTLTKDLSKLIHQDRSQFLRQYTLIPIIVWFGSKPNTFGQTNQAILNPAVDHPSRVHRSLVIIEVLLLTALVGSLLNSVFNKGDSNFGRKHHLFFELIDLGVNLLKC